jgi:hypothetical protein
VKSRISVERLSEPPEAMQFMDLTPVELRAVYDGLRMYYEQGIWNFQTVRS